MPVEYDWDTELRHQERDFDFLLNLIDNSKIIGEGSFGLVLKKNDKAYKIVVKSNDIQKVVGVGDPYAPREIQYSKKMTGLNNPFILKTFEWYNVALPGPVESTDKDKETKIFERAVITKSNLKSIIDKLQESNSNGSQMIRSLLKLHKVFEGMIALRNNDSTLKTVYDEVDEFFASLQRVFMEFKIQLEQQPEVAKKPQLANPKNNMDEYSIESLVEFKPDGSHWHKWSLNIRLLLNIVESCCDEENPESLTHVRNGTNSGLYDSVLKHVNGSFSEMIKSLTDSEFSSLVVRLKELKAKTQFITENLEYIDQIVWLYQEGCGHYGFLVQEMEYIEGLNLGRADKLVKPAYVDHILFQILYALYDIQRKTNIIVADLSPKNIMLTNKTEDVLIDMGSQTKSYNTPNLKAVLIDFGGCIEVGDRSKSGTLGYSLHNVLTMLYGGFTKSPTQVPLRFPLDDLYAAAMSILVFASKFNFSFPNGLALQSLLEEKTQFQSIVDEIAQTKYSDKYIINSVDKTDIEEVLTACIFQQVIQGSFLPPEHSKEVTSFKYRKSGSHVVDISTINGDVLYHALEKLYKKNDERLNQLLEYAELLVWGEFKKTVSPTVVKAVTKMTKWLPSQVYDLSSLASKITDEGQCTFEIIKDVYYSLKPIDVTEELKGKYTGESINSKTIRAVSFNDQTPPSKRNVKEASMGVKLEVVDSSDDEDASSISSISDSEDLIDPFSESEEEMSVTSSESELSDSDASSYTSSETESESEKSDVSSVSDNEPYTSDEESELSVSESESESEEEVSDDESYDSDEESELSASESESEEEESGDELDERIETTLSQVEILLSQLKKMQKQRLSKKHK